MEFGNGSSDDHEENSSDSRRGRRSGQKQYHRHTSEQIQQLESFFKDCPHPDESQRLQLSRDLGLEPKQIKFWFQNRRTQAKAQNERADNNTLKEENERISCENLVLGETLKNLICPNCRDTPLGEEERLRNLQQLQLENEKLKEEHARLSAIIATISEKPARQIHQALLPSLGSFPLDHNLAETFHDGGNRNPCLDDILMRNSKAAALRYPFNNGVQESDRLLMMETVTNALKELIELMCINEPVWIKYRNDQGNYVIHRESYDKIFPKPRHLTSSGARFESSKDSVVVPMNGLDLVEMFMHPTDWVDLFPTLVTQAKTLEIIDCSGHLGGALHLIYKQMHILSPLVPLRDFLFLRYCQQLDPGSWVIMDVSYDFFKETQETRPIRCWRLPSGCIIQNLPDGKCKVTWVEHVEVDDKNLTHRLFRDLVCGPQAYGATLWLATLQRSCERFAFSRGLRATQPHELEGVINSPEGRRSVMQLGNKMVKNFCAMLTMLDKVDFPQSSEMRNSRARVSVRGSIEPGRPMGMIVSAAASFWLPVPCQTLFNYFKDENTRPQWDMLSNGTPVNEIAHISCGSHPANCISILRPFVPQQNITLVLQESCIDPLGALVVYAPTELETIATAIRGQDTANLFILPSGFTISSGDGRQVQDQIGSSGNSSGGSTKQLQQHQQPPAGSLVTVAFQVFIRCDTVATRIDFESVTTINTLITSTVQKIKAAFNVADLD